MFFVVVVVVVVVVFFVFVLFVIVVVFFISVLRSAIESNELVLHKELIKCAYQTERKYTMSNHRAQPGPNAL